MCVCMCVHINMACGYVCMHVCMYKYDICVHVYVCADLPTHPHQEGVTRILALSPAHPLTRSPAHPHNICCLTHFSFSSMFLLLKSRWKMLESIVVIFWSINL